MSSTLAANSRSTVAIRITAAIATLAVAITAVATRPEMVMTALHAVMGMTR